jgi:transcriptional regulator with XRE-family HTH domain
LTKYNDNIGSCRLHILLDKNCLTLTELSLKSGISLQQLSQYANNKRIMSISTARKIAQFFEITIDDLYEWID